MMRPMVAQHASKCKINKLFMHRDIFYTFSLTHMDNLRCGQPSVQKQDMEDTDSYFVKDIGVPLFLHLLSRSLKEIQLPQGYLQQDVYLVIPVFYALQALLH